MTRQIDAAILRTPTDGRRNNPRRLHITAVPRIPAIEPNTDLAAVIGEALEASEDRIVGNDILIIAQKIVSKAEGRYVDLATVRPSPYAFELAKETGKDARLVEVILSKSNRVVRHRLGVLIVEHKLGFIVANAGVDQSNVDPAAGREPVLLLPASPDSSAERLRAQLTERFQCNIGVVISDSFGRAWRLGTTGIALGAAGVPSLLDLRGQPDLFGRALQSTEVGFADEIAAAASLLMGQADEGCPVVLIRGLSWSQPSNPASSLLRNATEDLFR